MQRPTCSCTCLPTHSFRIEGQLTKILFRHQVAPHLLQDRSLLTDYLMEPYGNEIQAGYRSGRVAVRVPIAQGCRLPWALEVQPPTAAAARFTAEEAGASEGAIIAASERAVVSTHNRLVPCVIVTFSVA